MSDTKIGVELAPIPDQASNVLGLDGEVLDLEDRELFGLVRRKWNLTQGDVAKRAGSHQSVLSSWERGRKEVTSEQRHALWSALVALVADAKSSTGTAA